MSKILIGTASWTERTLIESGTFYPHDVTSAKDRLKYYAGYFDTVEVDSTYYSPPSERNSALWAERTPPGFIFHIKAYSMLTRHTTLIESIPKAVRQSLPPKYQERPQAVNFPEEVVESVSDMFISALRPLKEANKLGCLLFQFPPYFFPSSFSYQWMEKMAEKFHSFRLAVEFRNWKWLLADERKKAVGFLKTLGISYVGVDAPWVKGWQGPLELTSSISYIRLHGRNKEDWFKKGAGTEEKYRYAYTHEELEGWRDRIENIAKKAERVFVIFNNCFQNYAIKNAEMMKDLLYHTSAVT